MRALQLVGRFIGASAQQSMAYRSNFLIRVLVSVLSLVSGLAGIWVLYGQIDSLHGWDMPSALALFGVYLLLTALRDLVISPSLESISGMDGEVWQGTFDYTILKPVNKQFLISLRKWNIFAILDVVLALGVLAAAVHLLGWQLSLGSILGFVVTLGAGLLVYYSLQLAFAALVLYKPTFLFTWVFHGFFQLARYPVQIYPDWLRIMLSWIIPVALMTTIPAQVLRGEIGWGMTLLAAAISVLVFAGASLLFHFGMRHYSSASS